MTFLKPCLTLGMFFSCLSILFAQSSINGELKKWHTVTLQFDGEETSENNPKNPFLNHRLNLTLTAPSGKTFTVPGFYAADGNAAETSALSGNKWAVRFTPNETGEWTYNVSFRTGTEIAVDDNPSSGTAIAFDGSSGSFSIAESDKSLPDNRAKGRLNYVGERYLKFEETNTYFLKAGSDSPENLLAYDDFDNTVTDKTWSPHAGDWNPGDPSWQNGKGKELIGAVNYLANKGMNAFSFLTMNVNGDGKDVWPYAETAHNRLDDASGNDALNRLRFDVSKLEQWEILFAHADTKGMYLHFKIQEEENDQLLDGGRLGVQRKLYYRELIARFGHHLALNWNMGEENTQTIPQKIESAKYIKETDPYNHHIVMHTFPHQQLSIYSQLVGDVSDYTGASLQTANINNVHTEVKKWLFESEQSGKQWVVTNDEQGDPQTGVTVDELYSGLKGTLPDNRADIRHKVLWATLMSGGAGVEYYFGYQTGVTDLTAEDFRSRNTKWEDAKIALDFFNSYLPFWEMRTNDALTSDSNDFCFAKEGEAYAIYLPDGGSTNLDLSGATGNFSVKWFDPSTGGDLVDGSISVIAGGKNSTIGSPPNNIDSDWVALIQKTDALATETTETCSADYVEKNGLVVIEAENLNAPEGWSKKTSVNGFTGEGYLEWEGGDNFRTPGAGLISTAIEIKTPGTYSFEWRNKIGEGTSTTDFNDSWLRFADASDFYGEKSNGSRVYPGGSGKFPAPEGDSSDGWLKIFSSGTTDWTFSTRTNDRDGHLIYVQFDSPGTYTLEISGRSDHHIIDRIVLSREVNNATDLSLNETLCETSEEITIAVESITAFPDELTLDAGDTFTIEVNIAPLDASDPSITWSTNDSAIATVDDDGMVTAIQAGVATITATTVDGGFTSFTVVTVEANTIAVTGISTTPSSLELIEGETFEISAIVTPADAKNTSVVWNSSDPQVALVDDNGKVIALKAGSAVIRATTEDGNFESATAILVQPVPEVSIPVRFVRTNSNIRTVQFDTPFTILATIVPSNATNQGVIWASSDPSIATVDENGFVTPQQSGKVTITVTTIDGDKRSTADITIVGGDTSGKTNVNSLTISPNPARSGSRIHLQGMPGGLYTVDVIAFDGSLVATEPADVTNSHYLKSNRLKPGIYVIRVSGQNGVYTGKLVIQ